MQFLSLRNNHVHAFSHSAKDNALWETLVERSTSPDIYFRPSYLRLSEIIGGGEAIALLCNWRAQSALCPLLVRREPHVSDAFTPYGYGGLLSLSQPHLEAEETACIFENIRRWCKSEGLTCCLLRMHPLLADRFDLSGLDAPNLIVRERGRTLAIDLKQWDLEHQRIAGLKKGRVSDLSYARKCLSVVMAEGTDRVRQYMPAFCNIYDQTMQRVQATPFYRFPQAYYRDLVAKLGEHAMLCLALSDDRPVGAALFLHDRQFTHYHLSGTTIEGMKMKASTLLVNEAAAWARSKGCGMLHLGGGNRTGDGLYNFKASFGGLAFPYIYITIVADMARYQELIAAAKPIWPYRIHSPAWRGTPGY